MPAKLEKTGENGKRLPDGIYRRGSRYVVRYRANGRPKWESCGTLREARSLLAARKTDADRGELHEESNVTLHVYAREWIDSYQGRGKYQLRDETRADYGRLLDQYALRFWGERVKLREVTRGDVAKFLRWLGRPDQQNGRELAAGTQRGILAPLRAMFATAADDGVIRFNPAQGVRVLDRARIVEEDDERARALASDELATFLRVVNPKWRTFFELLAATGLRISEAIALEWRDVQLDGSTPHVHVRRRIVRGKVGPLKSDYSRRRVPIPHHLVLALRQARRDSEWPRDDDPVFPNTVGKPLSSGNVFHRVLKPAAEEAGIAWVGFHAFRHTCASMLFASGRNAVQVQRWLGHHSPAFTLATYVHLLDGELGDPLDVAQVHTEVHTDPTREHDTAALLDRAETLSLQGIPDTATLDDTARDDF